MKRGVIPVKLRRSSLSDIWSIQKTTFFHRVLDVIKDIQRSVDFVDNSLSDTPRYEVEGLTISNGQAPPMKFPVRFQQSTFAGVCFNINLGNLHEIGRSQDSIWILQTAGIFLQRD